MTREELAELKALAEALLPERTATVGSVVAFITACAPEVVIYLIDQLETHKRAAAELRDQCWGLSTELEELRARDERGQR